MSDYRRLTERSGEAFALKSKYASDNIAIWHAIKRLAELEDKIENGTLIDLPCKVGDKVYIAWVLDIDKVVEGIVSKVECIVNTKGYYHRIYVDPPYNRYIFTIDEVFLTKAEAEAKLRELKGE